MKFKHTLQISNEFKSFKNSMFEVLSNRILFEMRHIVFFFVIDVDI